jgi:solute carrier family 25 protein 39/40
MSGFVAEPLRADDEAAQLDYGDQTHSTHSRMSYAAPIGNDDAPPEPEHDISAGQRMLSATSGSLLTSLLVTPLDVVRVRLQSQTPKPLPSLSNIGSTSPFRTLPPNLGVTACCREVFWINNNAQYCIATNPSPTPLAALSNPIHATTLSAADCAIEENRRKAFTSTFDGLRKIARNEGLPTLWRGLSPTLVMAIPANVIYFSGYDYLRYNHSSPIRNSIPDNYAPLAAGAIARVAAAIAVSPIEMFRTRMQAASGTSGIFRETLVGLQDMVKTQGYTSLWRGLTLTMWRDVPFSGIYWWGYEAIRNGMTDWRHSTRGETLTASGNRTTMRNRSRSMENHTSTLVDSFLAGALAGAIASVVTTPFDVGKTRQQVHHYSSDNAGGNVKGGKAGHAARGLVPEERSMPRFLYHIYHTEGVAGLFRGGIARCLKVAPACAIMISSYEVGKKMASRANDRKAAGEVK